jgi:predicted ribosomally synthesized peptide with nif11-like leader
MSETLVKLVEKVKADKALEQQFKACQSKEDQVALAKKNGFDISVDELMAAEKVSDDQLDQVAGGGCTLYITCVF